MDRYFQTYYDSLFVLTDSANEATAADDSYEDYYQEIGPDILSLPDKYRSQFKNGDFIAVEIEGGIMESYPVQAKVKKAEKIAPRLD
jgi:hypothetical protein